MTATPEIVHVPVPPSWDAPGAELFRSYSELTDEILLAHWGSTDRGSTPDARLAGLQDTAYETYELYLARLQGRPVGRAWVSLSLRENLATAWVSVLVLPQAQGRGVGRALAQVVEERSRVLGRSQVIGFSEHPATTLDPEQEQLQPSTGAGSVPAQSRSVQFAQRRGYVLEQLERESDLEINEHSLRIAGELGAEADSRAGADFEILSWQGPVPEEHLGDLVALRTAMSTDVPQGELGYEEERWDAERIRSLERELEQSNILEVTTVARHRPSGRLVAMTFIEHDLGKPKLAWQEDTIVLREFRGHRLGQLIKSANLAQLHAAVPAVARVRTGNADENAHMLAINTAMGFAPSGYSGTWKKKLEGAL